MMKTWTDEELIAILRESKEWKDCVDSCRQRWGASNEEVDRVIPREVLEADTRPLDGFSVEYQPLIMALRALANEVKTGAIFGSPERCAICGSTGKPPIVRGYSPDGVSYFRHDRCVSKTITAFDWRLDTNITPQQIATTIIRARELYRTAREQDCSTCSHSGGGCPLDQDIPGHCDCSPTSTTCGICGGPSALDKERDVYHCRHCNAEALGAPIRYQPDKIKWVCYPRKADDVLDTSTPPSTPPASKAPIAPEDIQYPVECKTLAEKSDWLHKTYGGSQSVLCWKCRQPHDPNDGSWISAGTDLRLLDAGCRADFDAWSARQLVQSMRRELSTASESHLEFERWVEKQHRRTRGPDPVVIAGLFDPRRRR